MLSTSLSWIVCAAAFLPLAYGSKTCNVRDYGAKGDGSTDDTKAVQKAIDDCVVNGGDSKWNQIYFPSGRTFKMKPILVKNTKNIEMRIASDCTLQASTDISGWPKDEEMITFDDVNGYVIRGDSQSTSLIDGRGSKWWGLSKSKFRPCILRAKNCKRGEIYKLKAVDAPYHTFVLKSDDTEVHHVTLLAPSDSPNTDAIDVTGKNMYIHDCHLDVGDDNVAVHSNGTYVDDCYFGTGHGASIGSLKEGWYHNITFKNIIFDGTTNGIRIKTWSGAGKGHVWDVTYKHLVMKNVKNAIIITQYYGSGDTEKSKLYIDDVKIWDVNGTKITNAGLFKCQPSTPCKHITLKDVNLSADKGFECKEISGTTTNVSPKACF